MRNKPDGRKEQKKNQGIKFSAENSDECRYPQSPQLETRKLNASGLLVHNVACETTTVVALFVDTSTLLRCVL